MRVPVVGLPGLLFFAFSGLDEVLEFVVLLPLSFVYLPVNEEKRIPK